MWTVHSFISSETSSILHTTFSDIALMKNTTLVLVYTCFITENTVFCHCFSTRNVSGAACLLSQKSSDKTWTRLLLPKLIFTLCAAENVGRLVTPAKKLEDTIRLSELVIEVLQQNEEHHAEVSLCTYHAQ